MAEFPKCKSEGPESRLWRASLLGIVAAYLVAIAVGAAYRESEISMY